MNAFFYAAKTNCKDGFLQKLDPRAKIISFSFLILAVISTPSQCFYKFLVYFLMLFLMIFLSRMPLEVMLRRFVAIIPLAVFITLSLIIFEKRPFSENLLILWSLFIKSALCVLCLGVLVSTTDFYLLVKGLSLLKFPRIAASLLSFAHRYVFLFAEQTERMIRAKKSRTFTHRERWRDLKMMINLVPRLFFNTLERSERIYAAMLSRGFKGDIEVWQSFRMKASDFAFVILIVLPLISVVIFL